MSVDIGEIYVLDREIYYDIVSLWADNHCSPEERRKLVDVSFKGAGTDKFIHDRSTLSIVDPMNVDMCNISFYQVHEDVPLPPTTDTIGSDYFLMHAVECARLPGVHHNRHIENFYTPGRKNGAGFMAYHMRLTKFFLSMIYFHDIYKNMARAGESLLDQRHRILISPIIEMARQSLQLDKRENEHKLNVLIDAYTRLGGRYASFAGLIAGERHQLILKAEQDINDFCVLMEAWAPLMNASKVTCLSEAGLCSSRVGIEPSRLKLGGESNMIENRRMRAALAAAATNSVVFDLEGIRMQYDSLLSELPEVDIRFALKSCPVDEVLATLTGKGAGFDAASVNEIKQALRTGVPAWKVHFGNTIKSNQQIAEASRLGIRDFATDSLEDVEAIAEYAAGASVFCRLSTDGDGALWGLNRKFGCSETDALAILQRAESRGLKAAGLSVHVGSQQMKAKGWQKALSTIAETVRSLRAKGIILDYINLGGGLPAVGYTDRSGRSLVPPLNDIFVAIRAGMQEIKRASGKDLHFIMEPGRYLVADQGAIKAQVIRMTTRQLPNGEHQYWLYISCGKFSGLYETDALQFRLVFPSHAATEYVPAIIAGPTCDSDDMFPHDNGPIYVPWDLAPGDPVWILSCGAYSISYMMKGFNGFEPLLITMAHGQESSWCVSTRYSLRKFLPEFETQRLNGGLKR
jgi:ornithine decarboxylase